ncbi:type VI secretion system membrane subunit TssM [Fulvimonas sp. R45]|uniref:type VI secretion system membrane subunit TssM n=1 Tax=Fulvimonas sp. R45 TaxID=3045937 RepID=UPI00265E1DF2|nr:type VI secretion system membrane subunit TssM [Fulvimonas sp. R45]MDO1530436.1 type VI secretion system membrane subunit TssM [Fulvimonas sp. R45]
MNRLRYLLTDSRTLAVIGIAVMAALFLLGRNTLKMIAFWIGVALVAVLVVLIVLWVLRRLRARRSSEQLGEALLKPSANAGAGAGGQGRNADVDALRERLREAVKAIKTSRLGQTRGTEALYELPWYMIIGNPAAGKSTAVVNSGLRFPFADNHGSIVQGIGGTRNCDWYFTTEGILLDTAGRYSVQDENRSEWLSFLELLRKHRPRAPINGIVIAASIAELTGNRPEFAINLAKNLRQRVQELTEWLEVIAPVYVVFTKADLIAGFNDFFHTLDDAERERVWGTTLPFQPDGNINAVEQFDRYFDELSEGLKEMSLSQMSLNRGNALAPGLLTLPLEFTGIKATLRTFITTLFEDNPFQFRPVFRGFYFTSALQEAASVHHASDRIAQRYGLSRADGANGGANGATSAKGYFLLDLFRKVIFADRQLVRQYSSRHRMRTRYAVLLGSALALGLALGGWAWSYTNNRQLVANVQADLDKVVEMQKGRIDLQSRLQALQILQDRLQQLDTYRHDHPLMLGLGLYQGGNIEHRLRAEYFQGMQQLMLVPVAQNLEAYLDKVVAHRDQLVQARPGTDAGAAQAPPGTYLAPSPTNAQDAYNALKAYLMLGDPGRVEPVHLSDQLTRFWREWLDANRGMMTRDQLIGSADRLMSFYVAQYDQPGWPTIDDKVALVDDTRQALRHVMRGMPAINRVYAEIQARAATRYPSVSVASILGDQGGGLLAGSYAIPGTFTREAWEGYVKDAIRDAANNELNATDWVLQTTQQTDLTLSGSPEQIQKQLETLYDKDYVAQWQKFLQGVSVTVFGSFDAAVKDMNVLGDPQDSPMRKLLETVYRQTSWDNPSLVDQGLKSAKGGFVEWFKRVILRRTPAGVDVNLDNVKAPGSDGKLRAGPVGSAFAGVARLMVARDNNPPLLNNYLDMLAKLRTRLNAIKNQGDPGPGARDLMQKTLGGSGSELSSGLQLVDEQMLDGLDDRQRNTLRPLLLRPLMQAFQALVPPTETEVNKIWTAQVYTPFEQNLARKYPFDTHGQIQATDAEIGQVFGPSGAIAKFAGDGLGPLVDRRGDTLTAKQWADMGITLSPKLMAGFAQWVAPLGQTAAGGNQIVFMIQPEPGSGGISEYTININGHTLRYRNTPPTWEPFTWDGSQPNAVAQVSAVTFDGRTVSVADFAGDKALGMLIKAAKATNNGGGNYTLTWTRDAIAVTVHLKLVSGAQTNADGSQKQGLQGVSLPAAVAGSIDGSKQPTMEGAP